MLKLQCTLRYKDPNGEINKEIIKKHSVITDAPTQDFIFAASVAEFGLILRDSEYKSDANCQSILSRINNVDYRQDTYKNEFIELIIKYSDRQGKVPHLLMKYFVILYFNFY